MAVLVDQFYYFLFFSLFAGRNMMLFFVNERRDIANLKSWEENDADPKKVYYITLCIEEVCQAIIDNAFRKKGDEYIQLTLC